MGAESDFNIIHSIIRKKKKPQRKYSSGIIDFNVHIAEFTS